MESYPLSPGLAGGQILRLEDGLIPAVVVLGAKPSGYVVLIMVQGRIEHLEVVREAGTGFAIEVDVRGGVTPMFLVFARHDA